MTKEFKELKFQQNLWNEFNKSYEFFKQNIHRPMIRFRKIEFNE